MTVENFFGIVCLSILVCLVCVVNADSSPNQYELPSNASAIIGRPIQFGFSCDGLPYGYYADIANDCKIYHICYPRTDTAGFTRTRMWSFICGRGTVFNQEALVCDYATNSIPCENSVDFYNINEYFGRTDVNFRE